jgi:hypothetical protein
MPDVNLSPGDVRVEKLAHRRDPTSGAIEPYVRMGAAGAWTNRSGTITAGGTAQVLAAANPARRGVFVQNHSGADLWLNDLGVAAAAQPSIRIPAGMTCEFPLGCVPVTALSIFGATTGQPFTAREW